MRKFCCVLLALLPLTAFAYTTDVSKDIQGVKIDYSASDIDSNISSIRLTNYGANDAVCKLVFTNGPEAPVRARSRLRRAKAPTPRSISAAASSKCASS